MADTKNTGTTGATPATTGDGPAGRELKIMIWLDQYVEFEGTASQLDSEGLIPSGFEWPEFGSEKEWKTGELEFCLHRRRPAGHKGPMSSWLELGNWVVRVSVSGLGWRSRRRHHLDRQAEQLRAQYRQLTDAGEREWNANWRRYEAAMDDERFRAFKALIPGLVPPKRGRKPSAPRPAQSDSESTGGGTK